MLNKTFLGIALIAAGALSAEARADIVHLSSGRNVSGKIATQDKDKLTLEIEGAMFTFPSSDIEWVIKGSEEHIINQRRVAGYFETGQQKFDEKKYLEAAAAYEAAIAADPEHVEFYNNAGAAYAEAGDSARAIRALEKGLSQEPWNASIQYNLSQIYMKAGKYDKAEDLLQKMTPDEKYFSAGDLLNLRGNCAAMRGRLDQAAGFYKEALIAEPGHAEAKDNLQKVTELRDRSDASKKS